MLYSEAFCREALHWKQVSLSLIYCETFGKDSAVISAYVTTLLRNTFTVLCLHKEFTHGMINLNCTSTDNSLVVQGISSTIISHIRDFNVIFHQLGNQHKFIRNQLGSYVMHYLLCSFRLVQINLYNH